MNDVLETIAHTPTEGLPDTDTLTDKDFMRVATLLARKSYDEGGCPIGAVIVDAATKRIIGKGHNTLVQENDAATHGETAAIRDAGRVAKLRGQGPVDFRRAALYTTLTPCAVCCAQIIHRCQFQKVVIGDVTSAPSTAKTLRDGGIENVVILEDPEAVALYRRYAQEKPGLHYLDWGGHRTRDEMTGGD
ncbi:MAG: nucleoside deaminase [Alphaproteobacteria bacterium]|nr:nucleoside deaminase [Alphaproteobacteria bacterium]